MFIGPCRSLRSGANGNSSSSSSSKRAGGVTSKKSKARLRRLWWRGVWRHQRRRQWYVIFAAEANLWPWHIVWKHVNTPREVLSTQTTTLSVMSSFCLTAAACDGVIIVVVLWRHHFWARADTAGDVASTTLAVGPCFLVAETFSSFLFFKPGCCLVLYIFYWLWQRNDSIAPGTGTCSWRWQ